MLKINLSGEQDNKEETGDNAVIQSNADTMAEPLKETSDKKTKNQKTKSSGSQTRSLVLLVILAIVALVYFKKDMILSLFSGKPQVVEPVMAPPPPPPQPESEPVPKEPDPTFVVLNGIGEAVPQKVWLSSLVVMYDGTYEIKGIAFSHESINTLIASLGTLGKITSQSVPKETKLSETVYNFSVNGVFSNINVPEILDMIPTDNLISMAGGVTGKSSEIGVSFTGIPKSGQTYTEKDLPFAVEGSFEGLKKVVAELCPEGGDVKIYRLVIIPASPGRAFDKIKASFSLRTKSSV